MLISQRDFAWTPAAAAAALARAQGVLPSVSILGLALILSPGAEPPHAI